MPVLTREDGTQFVTQSYRELLARKGTLALKTELRSLAHSNGSYMRVYPHNTAQFEAVFSTDPGYLLGETLWVYFNKPSHLFYCEPLDADRYLVVMVKNRMVYLDAVLDRATLDAEISALSADQLHYTVIVAPGVELAFPEARVSKQTQLEAGVFTLLPLLSQYQLLNVDRALQAAKLRQLPYGIVAGMVSVAVLALWLLWPAAPNLAPESMLSPQQQLQQALASPAPSEQLREMQRVLLETLLIPGWQLQSVQRQGQYTRALLRSTAGLTRDLINWAQARGYQVQLTAQGAVLNWRSPLPTRTPVTQVTTSLDSLSALIDRMLQIMPEKSVDIGTVTRQGWLQSTALRLHFSQLSIDVFELLAHQLSDLPLALQAVNINVKNGLLTGTIKLTVIGN